MIGLFILAQVINTLPPHTEAAKPATSWQCDFNDPEGATFSLSGQFPEIPAGSDPNGGFSVMISGNGPKALVGPQRFNGFDSYPQVRFYQTISHAGDGSQYVISFALRQGDKIGMAQITRYVPSPNSAPGKLLAMASGSCRATFHPLGFKGKGK